MSGLPVGLLHGLPVGLADAAVLAAAVLPTAPALASDLPAILAVFATLGAGVYVLAAMDEFALGLVSGTGAGWGRAWGMPARRLALLLSRSPARTERPDRLLWILAPAAYAALAVMAMSMIPFAEGFAVADVRTGIVVFGAAEALTFVVVYLHGWSANSPLPLVGGYRYVAEGFSFMLVSMFVLIAVAIPAESLSVGRIVESQREMWNVIRQPLGLPLFVVVGLGAAFWGPLNMPDGRDLAGGTAAEVSGPMRLAWGFARRCMLVTYAVMSASVFLGGYLGPVLPGPVWLALKSLAVLVVFVAMGHLVGRFNVDRFMTQAWIVLLPLSFVGLIIAGVVSL